MYPLTDHRIFKTFPKHLLTIILFLLATVVTSITVLKAQDCTQEAEYTVKVVGPDFVFTASMPDIPNATYEWGWDGSAGQGEAQGIQLILPKSDFSDVPTAVRLAVKNDFFNAQCNKDVNTSSPAEGDSELKLRAA